ncbi:hypothetical protein QL996_16610, partial [Planococcus sp. APC 4015]|nr:hypothetical protein [Planococcus sp. APC 4015]
MESPVRSLVLWFPDWPVTALTRTADVSRPDAAAPGAARLGAPPPEPPSSVIAGFDPTQRGIAAFETARPDAAAPGVASPGATPPGLAGLDPARPIAVVESNLVVACSAAARAEGVRRGQRRRDAQSRCPALVIVAADAARDQRAFAPLVALIEEKAPGVQLVRPGLCALRARGPARYYGGEREAALMLVKMLREAGVADVRAGVADGPFTAEQSATAGATASDPVFVVPAGGAAGFLAPLSIAALDASALSPASVSRSSRASTPNAAPVGRA